MNLAQAGNARVALAGFPHDANSSYLRGAADAPATIREAFNSHASNSWTENGIDLSHPSTVFDAGDCDFQAGFVESIESDVSLLLSRGLMPICLGGDHSITYPILRVFHRYYPKLAVLHFDAHPDLYHDFEGNPFSHASPFARVMEEGLVQQLLQVGIRTVNAHQREQAARFGVKMIEMKDWRDDLHFEFEVPLYISFDMDGLDPACAPGVSHPEPGGLSTRQALRVIQEVKAKIVGADIVELNPKRDPLGITAVTCAKLVKEIAGQMLAP